MSLYSLSRDIGEWADATFGSNRSPVGALRHMQEEVEEAIAAPDDLTEYADILIALLDAVRNAGFTTDALLSVTEAKLAVNRQRQWGPPNEHGYSKHVSTERGPVRGDRAGRG